MRGNSQLAPMRVGGWEYILYVCGSAYRCLYQSHFLLCNTIGNSKHFIRHSSTLGLTAPKRSTCWDCSAFVRNILISCNGV